ncbi:MarR family winged helix-turn-helix transcriptional regulator [Gracilimonas amylolytica]|uniref:MarR family winged helix-turn-helix transcriptional regulator n=1 Tax=Gracilimonas amylolytica TaxID=1749045 RepID=UPI000CD9506B|nr:MarR family transcriptional regulator [Gracilimonas amylolytica]
MSTNTLQATDLSVWQELRNNIRETEVWMRNQVKDFLDEFEITRQQLSILQILKAANNEPLSTKEIQTLMVDKRSDTSRLVDRLIEKDLVRKRKDPDDGRLVQVYIKYEGLRLLAQIEDRMSSLDERFEKLNADEAEELNRLLSKLRD